jgi:nitroimidazol reductase NimA-like FMN-containing flavoprotein (pyridoxamine 5'-phosphate oxidase superfamily)/GNAT superfamily N-acetyltransferase
MDHPPGMRRELYRMPHEEAVALLARAPYVHLASTTPLGEPVLRVVHGVVVGELLAFHAAPAGEKMDCLGRAAVVSAEEVVAEIPSYFLDPERACPATTYYRSAQVHGLVEEVTDLPTKAAVLAALMEKFQPEGGHVPIHAEHPLYRKALEGLLVAGVRLERVDGKGKLGQNRKPEEITAIAEKLWQRGKPGDPAAIEALLSANPEAPIPAFLRGPGGERLIAASSPADADAAAELLFGAYWLVGVAKADIAAAQRGSAAWVVAKDADGRVVATARALSDGRERAWVFDVFVASSRRGAGLGGALVALLLDHPALRDVALVALRTRDAQRVYERLGFVTRALLPSSHGAWSSSEMTLARRR